MDTVYRERWREFPEYATYSGFHHYDDALESFTMAAFDRRKVGEDLHDVTHISSNTHALSMAGLYSRLHLAIHPFIDPRTKDRATDHTATILSVCLQP